MNDAKEHNNYASSGVNYAQLDPAKRSAQELVRATMARKLFTGAKPLHSFVGESAGVIKLPGNAGWIAQVEEGLGTLIQMCDWLYKNCNEATWYARAARGTVAMIVNDMITSGILPVSVMMHLAVGDSKWVADKERMLHLNRGWAEACVESGAAWVGGETPCLVDIVNPDTAVLAGSATGWLDHQSKPYRQQIRVGDRIIGVASSGLHCNGITFFRKIAEAQSSDVTAQMYRDGLTPTMLYSRLIRRLRMLGLTPSYVSGITGHGIRKVMRAEKELTYCITNTLPTQPIFDQFARLGNVTPRNMWGDYNMGTGIVLFVRPDIAKRVIQCAKKTGYTALDMGSVEKGPRRVIVKPYDLEFCGDELGVR